MSDEPTTRDEAAEYTSLKADGAEEVSGVTFDAWVRLKRARKSWDCTCRDVFPEDNGHLASCDYARISASMGDPKGAHVRGPGFLEKRFSIEEDGLLWLHACYGRGVDAFNAEDMLRAYEAGRAHPNTSSWKVHREGWFGGPAQDVSRKDHDDE